MKSVLRASYTFFKPCGHGGTLSHWTWSSRDWDGQRPDSLSQFSRSEFILQCLILEGKVSLLPSCILLHWCLALRASSNVPLDVESFGRSGEDEAEVQGTCPLARLHAEMQPFFSPKVQGPGGEKRKKP